MARSSWRDSMLPAMEDTPMSLRGGSGASSSSSVTRSASRCAEATKPRRCAAAGRGPPADDARRDKGCTECQLKKPTRWVTTAGVVAAVVVLHLFAFQGTDFQPGLQVDGWRSLAAYVGDAFPPDLDWGQTVKPGLEATLVTLWIGLLGTTLSVPLPCCWPCSQPTPPAAPAALPGGTRRAVLSSGRFRTSSSR